MMGAKYLVCGKGHSHAIVKVKTTSHFVIPYFFLKLTITPIVIKAKDKIEILQRSTLYSNKYCGTMSADKLLK